MLHLLPQKRIQFGDMYLYQRMVPSIFKTVEATKSENES